MIDTHKYDDFASCVPELSAPRARFTGKERDSESGNDYFKARYYSSAMGRFLSPDWAAKAEPVPYAVIDDPQSLNLYAYTRNNPVSRTDADGHWDSDQHRRIMEAAYREANLAQNPAVVNASIWRDFGGHSNWEGHLIDFQHEQYAYETQRNHFLSGAIHGRAESQIDGYTHSIDQLRTYTMDAYGAMKRGDQAAANTAMGNAEHGIGDSYAHTDRNAQGQITHLQCFTCSGAADDHHHPPEEISGTNSPAFQGSIDASAAYLQMMAGAGNMTQQEMTNAFNKFVHNYEQAAPNLH
jgi:RHS repeat-associated protein